MTNDSLLRAMRDVYVLVEKPNSASTDSTKYWSLKLEGLSLDDIRESVRRLRDDKKSNAKTHTEKQALKPTELYESIAKSFGAKSYEQWRNEECPKLLKFLDDHGMHTPTDLINCKFRPLFGYELTARRVADRFFNSGLPLPSRIYTGVGSNLFAPDAYGRADFDMLTKGCELSTNQDRFDYCIERADQVLLRAEYMKDGCSIPFLDLTGRMFLLHIFSHCVGGMYHLLGNNLMDPMIGEPVMRSYNVSEPEMEFELKLFEQFRLQIESSSDGWIEVLPVPDNSNIIFLKGSNGSFDWIIRDQRDEKFSTNKYYPFFRNEELPSTLSQNKLEAHLYFSVGNWYEELEHRAEEKHYFNGGDGSNWPGYKKLIEKELIAEGYNAPRSITGKFNHDFVPHRLDNYCLMVSPLISIKEFFSFYIKKNWGQIRLARAQEANRYIEENLMSVNSDQDQNLPVSVTWLDAIAYCRHFEIETKLPVRLISADEWRQIAPQAKPVTKKISSARSFIVKGGEPMPRDTYFEERGWCVEGSDGRFGKDSTDCHSPNGHLYFNSNFQSFSNSEGLEFVESPGFGEWLGFNRDAGSASITAAYLDEKDRNSIESNSYSIGDALRNEGFKVGFRICYVAHADA
jgi:hypothetical protein